MLLRGDAQHSIAAYFGVNGGRIAEIATGETFAHVTAVHPSELPPPGPYLAPCSQSAIVDLLDEMRTLVERTERIIRNSQS
jgi:hypothetical protein